MNIDRIINLLVTVTLIEMMATIGLSLTFAEIVAVAKSRTLLIRAAFANYVCVPAITVALLLWFHSPPMIAAGFLIVAVCPGAAYGPPFTAMAKGKVAVAVGLMAILAGTSAIVAPLLLRLLLPVMAGDQRLNVDAYKMVVTLACSQILPLLAGLGLRELRPQLAAKLKEPAGRASTILNLAALGLILAVRFQMLSAIRLAAFGGMSALLVASFTAGWLVGEAGEENRKAMAFSTSVRNVAVSLVIVTGTFPNTPAVTAALTYGLYQTVTLALIAWLWGRLESGAKPMDATHRLGSALSSGRGALRGELK